MIRIPSQKEGIFKNIAFIFTLNSACNKCYKKHSVAFYVGCLLLTCLHVTSLLHLTLCYHLLTIEGQISVKSCLPSHYTDVLHICSDYNGTCQGTLTLTVIPFVSIFLI